MVTRSELRARARHSLSGQWGRTALFMLLVFAICAAVNAVPVFGEIVSFICSGALSLGLFGFFLSIARGRRPELAEMFSGFGNFLRAFLLCLLTAIFTMLWTLLLVIPSIIAALRYSQAYFIMKDHPDIGASEAIRRSKAMMIGQKWRLFVLYLSFIGWFILCLFTLGIGLLWLYPYFYATMAHFYEDLRQRGEPVQTAFAPTPTPPPPYSF
ncbi:DUF975 family protein [Paenibacillus lycopersici]|nr:DUF975 family protein [Paenibacillus lycopersici]